MKIRNPDADKTQEVLDILIDGGIPPPPRPIDEHAFKNPDMIATERASAVKPGIEVAYDVAVIAYYEGLPWENCKMIAAQGAFESSNYTSNLFLRDNNAFGMKRSSVRKSGLQVDAITQPPSAEGSTPYAGFKSLKDSVLDVLHLYRYNGVKWDTIKTVADFTAWLKQKSYYGSSLQTYTSGVDTYFRQYSNWLEPVTVFSKKKRNNVVLIAGGIALLLCALWMLFRKKR